MGLDVLRPDLTKFARANKSKKNFYTNVGGEIVATAGTREQISRRIQSAGTLFVVPPGKVLYITSAYISSTVNSITNGVLTIGIDNAVFLATVIIVDATIPVSQESLALSFPTPLKVETGSLVRTTATNLQAIQAGFTGFLEDNSALFA